MRSASEAVAESRRWTTNRVGMCLYTVQTWLGAPWSGPWAEDAWHRWGGHHAGDKNPPPGVPVYWHNPRSKYGHIALSIGGGKVRSTDWPSAGRVGIVDIDTMTRAWGLRYLGWADRFSGGAIAGVRRGEGSPWAGGDVYIEKLRYGTRNSDSVRRLQHRLRRVRGIHHPAINGYYGPRTARAVADYQRKLGHKRRAARPQKESTMGVGESKRLFGRKYTIHD